jgi:hypothetical protein
VAKAAAKKVVAKTPPGKVATTVQKTKTVASKGHSAAKKVPGATFDSKFAPRQRPIKSVVTYRHILTAELYIGLILVFTKPSELKDTSVKTNDLIEASALILVFAGLFGVTAGGRNAARIASGFGALIILTLATQQGKNGRWTKDSAKKSVFSAPAAPTPEGPTPGSTSSIEHGSGK